MAAFDNQQSLSIYEVYVRSFRLYFSHIKSAMGVRAYNLVRPYTLILSAAVTKRPLDRFISIIRHVESRTEGGLTHNTRLAIVGHPAYTHEDTSHN